MKNIITVLTLLAAILFVGCTGGSQATDTTSTTYFGVTDAAPDMSNIESVVLDVERVRIRNASGSFETLPIDQQTFDLLALNEANRTEILSTANLSPGTYDRMRFEVDSVTVADNDGEQEAKLPSNRLKMNTDIVIGDTTNAVVMDFELNKSLHVTGNGQYILTPVITMQGHNNADVSIRDNGLEIARSKIRTDVTIGMDKDGSMQNGVAHRPGFVNISSQDGRINVENKRPENRNIRVRQ